MKGGERVKKTNAAKFSKYKYELSAFLLLLIQACLNIDFRQGMNRNALVFYLPDFSMAKTSRLLIGSFVNLFTDKPTVAWLNCFAAVVLLLTLIFTSILIGKVIKTADSEMRPVIAVFSLFFVSGAFTVWGYSKFFGFLDIYMYLFTVLSVVAVRNKMFRWLIPLFCIGGVLVNYVFTISYFPLIALVFLYLCVTSEKKAGSIAAFSATLIITGLLTYYCAMIGKTTATVTFEEMWQIMENKIGIELDYENVYYFQFYLFGDEPAEEEYNIEINDANPIEFIILLVRYLIKLSSHSLNSVFSVSLGVLPILIFFWTVWGKCIKLSETKLRKLVYLCFMLAPLFAVVCCALSTDLTRWAATGVLTQFGLGYFMFMVKDKYFTEVLLKLKSFLKGKTIWLIMIWIVYASFADLFHLTGN